MREAEARIGLAENSLLRDAIEGRLSVYVKVPDGMRVLCVHSTHLRSRRLAQLNSFEELAEPPFFASGVQYLALSSENLRGLNNNGFDRAGVFKEGISFDRDGNTIHFDAATHTKMPDVFPISGMKIPLSLRSYVLYPPEAVFPRRGLLPPPWSGEISLDCVYVNRVDILPRLNEKEIALSRRLASFEGAYISPNLHILREFFFENLKGEVLAEKGNQALKCLDIDLQSRFAFESTRAEAGAVILAKSIDAIYGSTKTLRIEEVPLLVLFDCAKHYWGTGDLKPSVDDIVTWLRGERLLIGNSYLEACAAMLRPPQFRKRGRPPSEPR